MLGILDTGTKSAKRNMQIDAELLKGLTPDGEPILRFYDWKKDSITYGYFINPEKHLNLEKIEKNGISLARRPTGGGIVFHIWDLAFSFLMPSSHPKFSLNTLENYQFVNGAVLDAVKDFLGSRKNLDLIPTSPSSNMELTNFCMSRPTKYDVVFGGKKVAGAAQRRRKNGYLHQGTISLALPKKELLKDVLTQKSVLQAMLSTSFAPLGEKWIQSDLDDARNQVEKLLEKSFKSRLN